MQINVSSSNMNALATRVAATTFELGFSKEALPMVASQGLRVLANLAGFREEHSFVKALKAEDVAPCSDERSLLKELTAMLLANYNDDQWDAETRTILERANAMVGGEPILWVLDPEEDSSRVSPDEWQMLADAGYTVSEDSDLPGMWQWVSATDACDVSFYSEAAAALDALAHLRSARSYAARSFELGSMSREQLLDALADAMETTYLCPTFAAMPCDDLRALVLEQEFPGSSDGDDDSAAEDEADSLGVDLDDVKFWVGLHYKVNFDSESADRKTDWLHRYRESNGLTP